MKNPSPEKQPSSSGLEMNRQTFVRTAIGGAGVCYAAALGYPVFRYLQSPVEQAETASTVKEVTLDAAKVPAGSALMFKFGSRPAMLIHHADNSWVALLAVCSHLGCTVQYDAPKDRIACACHGGVYNSHTGANVSGPPPRPLERLEAKVTDAGVVVTRVQKTA